MVRTRVGYTGGTTKNPSYYRIGDHTETIQIDFDPTKITYEQILNIYWATHNHCATPFNRQYMSAVFFANEQQKKIAIDTRNQAAAKRNQRITTALLPLGPFYLAEAYHQKYILKLRPDIMREFLSMYSTEAEFMKSTAAARINGYLGGHGTMAQLEGEIESFGLSRQSQAALTSIVKQYGR